MSEICLDCFCKEEGGRKISPSRFVLDEDFCEVCGQVKPCIVRYRRLIERLRCLLGLRDPWDGAGDEDDAED